ncbi:signal peptide peptidase SppA [Natronobiforma cellulositropha]|uniref:signal peptide peptidase SppA n=1 Tax=Natronobiforma cellulositropha TaxID=1679076 RepID=UPI0021D5A2CF|nr:signal peptide peptidase SppA [Natronobiforma cellulositropha]
MVETRTLTQLAVVLVTVAVFAVVGVALFVLYPQSLVDFLGVLAVLAVVGAGVKVAGGISRSLVPGYDVVEVAVEGPITRDGGGGPLPSTPRGTPADDIVEQIDRADDADHVEALLVKLNTPGGEVVPSDDIRLAADRFDGPTVAYTTDVCASGGYWIASGCDELWAREGSIVGSIGVIGSRVNATALAEKLGLSYEGFTAGEYKDAGMPLKEMSEDERAYLQGMIDGYYDHFVERVSEGRDLEPAFVRDTEARVYLGAAALENGLVDALGTREDVEEHVAALLERESVTVEEFTPPQSLMQRVGTGAQRVAYAFGAGVAAVVGGREFRLRT